LALKDATVNLQNQLQQHQQQQLLRSSDKRRQRVDANIVFFFCNRFSENSYFTWIEEESVVQGVSSSFNYQSFI
jgi:hypothetical protein